MRSRKQRLKGKKSRAQKRRAIERKAVRERAQVQFQKDVEQARMRRLGYENQLEIDRYGHYV